MNSEMIGRKDIILVLLVGVFVFFNDIFKSNYNGILVNRYQDGTENIGAHSDDEKYLDQSGVVAISYGHQRKFRIRDKNYR